MPISISMIALSSQLVVTVADRVPVYDIARNCKLDLADRFLIWKKPRANGSGTRGSTAAWVISSSIAGLRIA